MRNPIYSLSTRQIKVLQETARNLGKGGPFQELLPPSSSPRCSPTEADQHRNNTIKLYRSLHRQANRFFDEYTRRYLAQRIWKKFLAQRTLELNAINFDRIALLLNQGWKAYRLLVAANQGYTQAVNKVLDLAYGRRGHKKYTLLNPVLEYREPGELSPQELDQAKVVPEKVFRDRHHKRLPHFSSALNELATVERKLGITGKKSNPKWGSQYLTRPFQTIHNKEDPTGILVKDEKAFKVPAGYRDLNKTTKTINGASQDNYVKPSRVVNIHWKEFNLAKSSVFAPLPKHTVNRLELFVKNGKVREKIRMRARPQEKGKSKDENMKDNNNYVLNILKHASEPCRRSNIVQTQRAPRKNRFYRRMMARILTKTVTLQRNYNQGKWEVRMPQLSSGVPLSSGTARQFEGVDAFGNLIPATEDAPK